MNASPQTVSISSSLKGPVAPLLTSASTEYNLQEGAVGYLHDAPRLSSTRFHRSSLRDDAIIPYTLSGLAYVNTFTFDNFFYFDRQPYDENWYAYTHPQKDPFLHGYFSVEQCTFVSHLEKLCEFDEAQIFEIERLLTEHRDEMNLKQFEIHRTCPTHYREISPDSEAFHDLFSRMRNGGKWDPKFTVAWDKLTGENPAYRLNREFVSQVTSLASEIAHDEWMEELRENCQDTWTYDIAPYREDGETFESFFSETVDTIYKPTKLEEHLYKVRQIYSIDALPNLYLIRHSLDTYFYYNDLGNVVVPVCLPPHSGWMPHYIL